MSTETAAPEFPDIKSEAELREEERRRELEREVVAGYTMARIAELMSVLPVQKKVDFWVKFRAATGRIWCALPGPQLQALLSDADELFYGGAAGGGKSDLLLGAALTMHRKSIIFRREYTQFKDLVPRSRDIIGRLGRFNQQQMIWRDLPGNRSIEFGSVKTDDDAQKYKGRPHDLKAFDEVSDISEDHYLFLTGWLRTEVPGQRTRIIAAGNPPTSAEGFWVIRRWRPWLDPSHPNPAAPGELRWFARIEDEDVEVEGPEPFRHRGQEIKPKSRTFIPALLDDNPFYAGGDYRATLLNMPEPLRSQLLFGDFTIGLQDDAWQIIPTAAIIAAQNRWREIVQKNGGREPALHVDSLGVDVARGGKDKTVLAPRSATFFHALKKYKGSETRDGKTVALLAMKAMDEYTIAVVDAVGVGASAYDFLVEEGAAVIAFDARERNPDARDKSTLQAFVNNRAEQAWKMREALDEEVPDEMKLALPPDPELTADLCAYRWTPTPRGIQVESKEEIAKRIHRSTDCGDAVLNALWLAVVVTGGSLPEEETAAVGGVRPPYPEG